LLLLLAGNDQLVQRCRNGLNSSDKVITVGGRAILASVHFHSKLDSRIVSPVVIITDSSNTINDTRFGGAASGEQLANCCAE
jgi:hypothetical protein